MPVFLNSGNINAVHQMNYGGLSQNTLNFLQGQLEMVKTSPHFSGMYDAAKIQFETLNGEHAQRVADAVIRASKSVFDANIIQPLRTIEELQTANLNMQRWIMTSTFLRNEAAKGRINGYRDTYVDQNPGMVQEDCDDWCLMHSGLLYEVEGRDWEMKTYLVEYAEGDKPLTLSQRMDVFDSIQFAEAFVKAREDDPTSVYGDLL